MGAPLLVSVDSDTKQLPASVLDNLDGRYDSRFGGKYAPLNSAKPGNRFVFLGDSITQGSDQLPDFRGTAWPIIASIRSAGRIGHTRNAGVGGNVTQAMIDRFGTDVAPFSPTTVSLLAGTNDSLSTPFSAWTAQMATLISMIRSIGAVPIMATIPPNNGSGNRKRAILAQNTWIRDFAQRNGIAVVDFYAVLVDPATGNYKAAYFNDGTHPNSAGYAAMGVAYADAIAPNLPSFTPTLVSDDGDPLNILAGGCFTSGTGSTVPAGWIDNAGVPSGSTLSYTTDSAVPGQMLTIASVGTTGLRQVARTIYVGTTNLTAAANVGDTSITLAGRADFKGTLYIGSGANAETVKIQSSNGGGPQSEVLTAPLLFAHASGEPVVVNALPGETLLYSGRITSDGGVTATTNLVSSGGSTSGSTPIGGISMPVTRGVWAQRFTLPAGTTQILAGLQNGAGTGTVSWGQVGIYNLTRMGIS